MEPCPRKNPIPTSSVILRLFLRSVTLQYSTAYFFHPIGFGTSPPTLPPLPPPPPSSSTPPCHWSNSFNAVHNCSWTQRELLGYHSSWLQFHKIVNICSRNLSLCLFPNLLKGSEYFHSVGSRNLSLRPL